MARRAFASTPPVAVEITYTSLVSDVFSRFDVNDDATHESLVDFGPSNGHWDNHLVAMFNQSGRTDITTPVQALAALQAMPKTEAIALFKAFWNKFLVTLCGMINRYWKPATTPVQGFRSTEELVQALLDETVHGVDGDKLTLRIP